MRRSWITIIILILDRCCQLLIFGWAQHGIWSGAAAVRIVGLLGRLLLVARETGLFEFLELESGCILVSNVVCVC